MSPPSLFFAPCPACSDLASWGSLTPSAVGWKLPEMLCTCGTQLPGPCPRCLFPCRRNGGWGGLGLPALLAFPADYSCELESEGHTSQCTDYSGRCSYIPTLAQVFRGTFCSLLTGLSSGGHPGFDGLRNALVYLPAAVHFGSVAMLQYLSTG